MTELLSAAEAALHQWPFEPADIAQISYSENIVFRVETTDRRCYVLRMHRPGYHTYESLVSEQIWTRSLLDAGMDVPVPVPTRNGKPYGHAKIAGVPRHVGVLEWVEGATMQQLMASGDDQTSATGHFFAIGALLARLHDQAGRWRPPEGFTRHALDAEGLMGGQPFWGPFWQAASLSRERQIRFAELRQRIHRILLELPTEADHYSLIHADLHPGNVVVNGDRLHVIDFDDAGFGWHAYDIAVALKDYRKDPAFADYRQALVAGYRQHRSLSDETLALIPLFLLVRALAAIGWADARPELGHPDYALSLADEVDTTAEAVLSSFG